MDGGGGWTKGGRAAPPRGQGPAGQGRAMSAATAQTAEVTRPEEARAGEAIPATETFSSTTPAEPRSPLLSWVSTLTPNGPCVVCTALSCRTPARPVSGELPPPS